MSKETCYRVTVRTVDSVVVLARNIGEAKRFAKDATGRIPKLIWASSLCGRQLGKQVVTEVSPIARHGGGKPRARRAEKGKP